MVVGVPYKPTDRKFKWQISGEFKGRKLEPIILARIMNIADFNPNVCKKEFTNIFYKKDMDKIFSILADSYDFLKQKNDCCGTLKLIWLDVYDLPIEEWSFEGVNITNLMIPLNEDTFELTWNYTSDSYKNFKGENHEI